jgi:late competence protein required for DNA uptake (superfamily II DNA/RNA helicase)
MAERKDTSVEDLEREITCAICHDHYTDPKLLPCCHYYCKQCIHSLTTLLLPGVSPNHYPP